MITSEQVFKALESVLDPELHLSMVELGLIYEVNVLENKNVNVKMTFTTPFCPYASQLLKEIEDKIKTIKNVSTVQIELVWEPPWNPGKMTKEAQAKLGLDAFT